MKRITVLLLTFLLSVPAWSAPLSNAARTAIPAEIQQLIAVDYRALNNSPTALQLKDKVLPQPLKDFEAALKSAGVNPDKDVEQLVFASCRLKDGIRVIGVAQGEFAGKTIMARLNKQKIKGKKYRTATIYPMSGGMSMTLIDDYTMIFGTEAAVMTALDARDSQIRSLNSNTTMTDMMTPVQDEAVWSILDDKGTQTMLKSALGDAAQLADYDMVKNRLVGSRYAIKFENGFNFDLDVITSDSLTAATLSSILKAGVMLRQTTANDSEKLALSSVKVTSDSRDLKLKFEADNTKFQALLKSDLFAAVSK
jgi:hypothetical protein